MRYINTFSFRLFSATRLPDPILASRTIVVPLIRTPDRYRANADPMDFTLWPHDRQKLVDDLWLLGLAHLPALGAYEAAVNDRSTLTGRNLEPWRALLAVAGWLTEMTNDELRMTNQERASGSSFVTRHSSLVTRMMALSEAYQAERPNVETADLTGLVIRALGMIVGKMVRDESAVSAIKTVSAVSSKRSYVATNLITAAAQTLVESNEMDISIEHVTSRRVGRVLTKMRFINHRPSGNRGRGWSISLDDVMRWAISYGMDPSEITGIDTASLYANGTNGFNGTNGTAFALNPYHGEL